VQYYKPWDLLPHQRSLIDQQITDAQETFETPTVQEDDTGNQQQTGNRAENEVNGDAGAQKQVNTATEEHPIDNGPSDANEPHEAESRDRHSRRLSEEAVEDGGDDFVKGDEDDVLY
jgi:hypothetical protein